MMSHKKTTKRVAIGFIALGCPKNNIDSEKMLAKLMQEGFVITCDIDNADVIIVNTCAFIKPAIEEALHEIRNAIVHKRTGSARKVIVAGCLVERMGNKLFEQAKGIDAIVGLGQRDNIATIIKDTLASEEKGNFAQCDYTGISDDRARLLIGPGHHAYLRITEGCNHRCSFCTIPAIRGKFRSKPKKLILAEAVELVSSGVRELNIIGQDTSVYGKDLGIKDGLADLITEIERITNVDWIRLMYLHPAGITAKLVETIASSKKIVSYLDIPLQHINDNILSAMRRGHKSECVYKLIEKLRSVITDVVLRTTFIVGFPGETNKQFKELIEFVKWAEFDALGCFKYYAEEGTAAADINNQIPEDIKQQRFDELMLAQQKIAFATNRARIGRKLTCLVDSDTGTGVAHCRFYGQAPDIDSICILKNTAVKQGEFVDVKVVAVKGYDLIVEKI